MSSAPAPPPLADAEARRAIRDDLDATLFVEAAAGTGKTSELVRRVVALLRAGRASLDGIVAVTFTEKAAGEMKLRIRAEIELARAASGTGARERAQLDTALGQLELARIGTIHAFCADLLHERPLEAGVDPLFEVADEDEQARLLDQAFEAWLQRALADPPEGVRRVLRRRPRGPAAGGPRRALRDAVRALLEHRDFPAAWRREPFAREAAIDAVMKQLAEIGALASRATRVDDYLAQNLAEIDRFVAEVAHREAVRGRDHDGLEAELRELARSRRVHWHWRGSPRRPFAPDLPRADVIARRDAVKAELDAFLERADSDLAPLLKRELAPVCEAYQELLRRAGRLDFLDLLLRARDLVRDAAGVRAELQQRFTHFFVDEFQDTDPLQAEILLLLAADDPGERDFRRARPAPGKLFVVGDPKQSIYRFRRADVAVYEAVKRQLAASGARVVRLATSFRGVPSLQSAVNAAFAPRMGGDGGQAGYVPLAPHRPEPAGRPTIVALPVPRPYTDYGRIFDFRIEASLPDAVGAFVAWLVNESGWTVTERDRPDLPVRVRPRHVCLLFRRFQRFRDDVTRPYVRALEVRRVPHVLVGGRSFHDREEVLAIRNALAAIEWPDDELRVFATLRGPLLAFGDDALLAFRHAHGRLHPLRARDPDALSGSDREVAEALALLAGLHRRRNRRPIAVTLARLLAAVRAHAGIAIWPTGEQALANCLRTVDLARRFERGGARSFRAFVDHIEAQAERGESAEAPAVEEGTEGVRIMTVHKAKGLEFPVVILADPTCNATREPPTRHVDAARGLWAEPLCGCAPRDLVLAHEVEAQRDREEAVRLSYVAATRARDLLVVPAVGDPRARDGREGWLDVLAPALEPAPASRRAARAAPGCPPFGADSVLERPAAARAGSGASVQPGLHRPQAGRHEVVWWDPGALELDVEQTVGLRQQRVLEADERGVAADAGERAHAAWQASRRDAIARASAPSLRAEAVTRRAAAEAEAGETGAPAGVARVEEVALDRAGRPAGRRFGTLVHATLAFVDLDADPAAVRAAAAAQGRLLGASQGEVEAAARAAGAALAHPLLRRAAASGEVRRETPVLLRIPDSGDLVEGVVDLAFRERTAGGSSWTVVDFKTDRELDAGRARYQAQLRLYVDAVRAATGEPAEGVLLMV